MRRTKESSERQVLHLVLLVVILDTWLLNVVITKPVSDLVKTFTCFRCGKEAPSSPDMLAGKVAESQSSANSSTRER